MLVEDFKTGAWKRLKTHLEERLATLREANDSVNHTECKTASIRGQIAALKELLALPQNGSAISDGQPGESWPD